MIIEQILTSSMAVFCYLVADKKGGAGVLIDPADDLDMIFKYVDNYKITVKWVINTHGHFDHTSGNNEAMKRSGAGLMIHENDAHMLGKMTSRIMSRVTGGKGSPDAQKLLKDGDSISFGNASLKVIHTPGHSQGSICLYTKGHVFTGDTLFTEGMGRTDLGGGSYKEIIDSIRYKILSLPDNTIIWPGHHYGRKPSTTVKEQKRIWGRK